MAANNKPKKSGKKATVDKKAKTTAVPETTGDKQGKGRESTQFKPGVSGNPAGRPKGSRNKFCKAMLQDFAEVWDRGGIEALMQLQKDKPGEFVRASLQWVPQEFELGDKTQGSFRQLLEALTTGKVPASVPDADDDDE